MLLNIEHHTQYHYSDMVPFTIQQLRLTPRDGATQAVKHWQVKVQGHLTPFEDAFGNLSHTLVVDQPHDSLLISVSGQVETGVACPDTTSPALPLAMYLRETPLTQADPAMTAFARGFAEASPRALMQALRARIQYQKGVTAVDTPAAVAFGLGAGVCQDHAHAMIGCCRQLGWPAKYVSGYLFTADGSLMQTHAWVEVWHQGQWQGLDVANGSEVGETHVRLASGLDYRSASPVTGARLGGGYEGMASQVQVSLQVHQPAAGTDKQRQAQLAQLRQQAQSAQQ